VNRSSTTETNKHYDQDPALFASFLDPTLKYSSALYLTGDEDLATAQQNKLEFIADAMHAHEGGRYLDVGCGWGSLMLYLAASRGAKVVGITPSARQAEFVLSRAEAGGLSSLVEVRVTTIESATLESSSFDGASFAGSIVHMEDRVGALQTVADALCRDGRVYISESCYRSQSHYDRFSNSAGASFVREEVFGNGDMVPPSVLLKATEDAGFTLESATDLTPHYLKTIEAWVENIDASRESMDALSPGAADLLRRYLVIGQTGFVVATRQIAFVLARGR
jgi:cyclopropane-fatty-acyl-phospholipid synthase